MLLLSQVCLGQYLSIDTTYYANGQIHQIIIKLKGDSITIKKRFYSQHLKFENGVFLLGEKKSDKIEAIETYVKWGNGGLLQEGYAEYFYQNGQKRLEIIYSGVDGTRYINQWEANSKQILKSGNGIFTQFDFGPLGQDSLVYEIKDSLLHGKLIRYGKNETGAYFVRGIQHFEHNRPVGVKKTFTQNGKLISRAEYLNRPDSIFYEFFYENEHLKEAGVELKDQKTGIWKYYYESGIKEKEVEFQKNYYNGIYRTYHPNGIIKEEGNYIVIMADIERRYYNPETFEETIKIEKDKNSVKDGKWVYFDEKGQIEKVEYFNNREQKKGKE